MLYHYWLKWVSNGDDCFLLGEKYEFYPSRSLIWDATFFLRVLPVAVTGSPNLLCCILRYFTDFAFCCCVI